MPAPAAIRYRWITDELLRAGAVSGRQIVQHFGVSTSTAVRDCDRVAARFGRRVHGGIMLGRTPHRCRTDATRRQSTVDHIR